jgi:hypothetical protein
MPPLSPKTFWLQMTNQNIETHKRRLTNVMVKCVPFMVQTNYQVVHLEHGKHAHGLLLGFKTSQS